MDTEPDFSVSVIPTRALRALAVIAASVMVMAFAGIAYVHPAFSFFDRGAPIVPAPQAAYRVSAVDFVSSSTGWVVTDFDSGDFAILRTNDGGLSWTRQLSAAGQGHPRYLKFFDVAVGVFALEGTSPLLYRTADGGKTWVAMPGPKSKGIALSWSFVDSDFGWVLVSGTSPTTPLPAYLYRTEDGGVSWTNLGLPAPAPDQVFQVSFSYFTTGWLTSAGSGAYAYKSTDFGSTWTRVSLPAPRGGWPQGGRYLVAVQPTSGVGAIASVVFLATLQGRKGAGATIRDFPPLTVRAFDGGRPVTYTYQTAVGMEHTGPGPQAMAPNQALLSTVDNGATWGSIALPATGAIGYFDAAHWWWIGGGQLARSGDAGATWSDPAGMQVIEPAPGTLQVLDGQNAWFAGSRDGRPWLEATRDGGSQWRLVTLPAIPDSPTL